MKSGIVQMSTYFGQDQEGPPRRMIDVFTDDAKAVVESPNWITKYDLPAGWRFGYDIINVFGAGFSAAYTTANAGGGAITMTNTFGANTGGGAADGVITNVTADATGLVFTGLNGGFNGTVDLSAAVSAFETTTTLVDNGNGTFSYTNEDGAVTTISAGSETTTTLTFQGNNTWHYTNEAGTTTAFEANVNLFDQDDTLTANRSHQTQAFRFEMKGANGVYRFDQSNGQATTGGELIAANAAAAIAYYKTGGEFNTVQARDEAINLWFSPTSPLQISNDAGLAGQVLQSQGPNLPPIWSSGVGADYATVNLTATGTRFHDWLDFQQTEYYHSSDNTRTSTKNMSYTQNQFTVVDNSDTNNRRRSLVLQNNAVNELRTEQTQAGVMKIGTVSTGLNGEAWLRSSYSLGGSVGFEVAQDVVKVRSVGVKDATAVNGQVLTLVDAGTGEAEWQTAAAGGVNLFDADDVSTADRSHTLNHAFNISGTGSMQFSMTAGASLMLFGAAAGIYTVAGSGIFTQPNGVDVTIPSGDDLRINGDPGQAGEVLVSQGSGNAPVWQSAPGTVNAVNAFSSIPAPTTVDAGTVYLVNNDPTPALNGLWKADGSVGGLAVGWTQI